MGPGNQGSEGLLESRKCIIEITRIFFTLFRIEIQIKTTLRKWFILSVIDHLKIILIENVLANSKNQLFKMMLSDLWGILGNIK